MSNAHTPTPWIVDGDDLTAHIYTTTGKMVNAYHPDNTAFIVKACNSHTALLEALEKANTEFLRLAGHPGEAVVNPGVLHENRAALKLAQS